MMALVGSVLAASLLGSPHCAAMCGGFVCFVAGQDPRRRWLAQIAYHGGRLLSYVTLGALAGAIGASLDRIGVLRGVAHAAALVSGAIMLVWGGVALAHALGARLPQVRVASHRPIAAVLRRLAGAGPATRGLAIGLLTTLLPCGWLYLFAATAAGTGSAWTGAFVMAVFWVGTLPMLLGLGALARGALGPLARRMPAFAAVVLVVLGLLTIAGKFRSGPHHHSGGGSTAEMAAPAAATHRAPHDHGRD